MNIHLFNWMNHINCRLIVVFVMFVCIWFPLNEKGLSFLFFCSIILFLLDDLKFLILLINRFRRRRPKMKIIKNTAKAVTLRLDIWILGNFCLFRLCNFHYFYCRFTDQIFLARIRIIREFLFVCWCVFVCVCHCQMR